MIPAVEYTHKSFGNESRLEDCCWEIGADFSYCIDFPFTVLEIKKPHLRSTARKAGSHYNYNDEQL